MSKLNKLSEESLTRQPEEVFDIVCKLGEGSYGSVYKSIHKESSQVLAIKQVPVDTDLQEIIKEISIMQQCDSPYVVKYYGSYFKNTDLWIVMEYCGTGSVLDIMKLRGLYNNLPKGEVLPLTEDEIATILCDTLKGLEYLHFRKKIHRDIKSGNILLNNEGHAKLADFGVAGQLTDTMAKRNTVIGTPFWMAPEVIQEIGYDCVADIWSLGITALEMAEGKAPYGEIHPMRAIFMIPAKPAPTFNKPGKWSPQIIDFVSRCLVKNPKERATASELLEHEFIKSAKSCELLFDLIGEAQEMRERLSEMVDIGTNCTEGGTLLPDSRWGHDKIDSGNTLTDDHGTMIQHATLTPDNKTLGELESNLGTMVINEDEDDTMKRHDTLTEDYRPAFLEHFDKKSDGADKNDDHPPAIPPKDNQLQAEEKSALQKQFKLIGGGKFIDSSQNMAASQNSLGGAKAQRGIGNLDDLELLNFLSYDELKSRMRNIDQYMEKEIDDLRIRYHAKRQPILDAMDHKRKRQQNF
ncbi:serine/threonine-protein kinase 4 isoform X2 [Lepeophtheirus salmonis]|uniref:serine/threonine-protein kinase 4 isoform X2 n=1 Tax=Lepeophtheirus salmonis TaxID=72036 RepID=UPI003AF3385C